MQLVHINKKMSKDGTIKFPLLQSWNPLTEVATIAAEVSGNRVLCRIAATVLQKKYPSSGDDPMQTVTTHRTEIENAARILIEQEAFDEEGAITIGYKDL